MDNYTISNQSRAMLGLWLGLTVALVYGLVLVNINSILFWGLPVYRDLAQDFLTLFESVVAGALLGYISNRFSSGIQGVIVASIVAALSVVFTGMISQDTRDVMANFLLMVYGFLPLATLFVPFTAILRWAVAQWFEVRDLPWIAWRKMRIPVILLGLAAVVGSFSSYPGSAREMFTEMDGYIQSARTTGEENVPVYFAWVVPDIQRASDGYSFSWTDDVSQFPMGSGSESLTAVQVVYEMVTIHFESGERVACLFRSNGSIQLCSRLD